MIYILKTFPTPERDKTNAINTHTFLSSILFIYVLQYTSRFLVIVPTQNVHTQTVHKNTDTLHKTAVSSEAHCIYKWAQTMGALQKAFIKGLFFFIYFMKSFSTVSERIYYSFFKAILNMSVSTLVK